MDNSKYGTPSQEWRDYDAAHPDLHINDEGKHDFPHFASPAALRDAINAERLKASLAGLRESGLDKQVAITTHAVPVRDGTTIPLRAYRPPGPDPPAPLPTYLFFHGGGMLFGTPEGEDLGAAACVAALRDALPSLSPAGLAVLSVCYRHTPEHVFPTQADDVWDAFEWVHAHAAALGVDAAAVVVGGISAGGSLTAGLVFRELTLARRERRRLRLRGQLLGIPWLVHRDAFPYELFASRDSCSLVQCADAPILPKERYDMFTDLLKVPDPREPLMNVGLAGDEALRGMPRTVLMVNGWDMLRDEAFLFARKIESLG